MSTPPMADRPVSVRATKAICHRAQLAALSVGSEPSVLLIPGFTGSKEDFLLLLPILDQAGISAQAIDLLGQFESEGTDDPSEYTLDRLSGDIVDIAGSSHRPLHLVGHSMGGLVSRAAVIKRPELFASLTLLDSGPAAIPSENQTLPRAMREALHGMTLQQIWEAKLKLDEAAGIPTPEPAVLAFMAERWVANNPFAMAAMVEIVLAEPDRTADLANAAKANNLPILVAYGEGDVNSWPPNLQQDMAERLSATVEAIPEAAHSPAVENPQATAKALTDFWGAK